MLFVKLHADVPLTRGPAPALQHGGIPMEPVVGVHNLTVWMAENDIAALAEEEDVLWIEEGPPSASKQRRRPRLDASECRAGTTSRRRGRQAAGVRRRAGARDAAVFSAAYSQTGGTVLFWDNAGDIETDYATARSVHAIDLTTVSLGSNTASNGYSCAIEGDYDVTDYLSSLNLRADYEYDFGDSWELVGCRRDPKTMEKQR